MKDVDIFYKQIVYLRFLIILSLYTVGALPMDWLHFQITHMYFYSSFKINDLKMEKKC